MRSTADRPNCGNCEAGNQFRRTNFIADDPNRVAALDQDLVELGQRFDVGTDSPVPDLEYLIFTARKVVEPAAINPG